MGRWITLSILVAAGVSLALARGIICVHTDQPGRDSPGVGPAADAPAVPTREQVSEEPPTRREIARALAPDPALAPAEIAWGDGNAARGAALFARHCAVCHGVSGSGEGPASVALNPKPRDFRDGTFYLDADANGVTGEDVDLARVTLEGAAAFGGSDAMQAWDEAFDVPDVRDLVAHIRTLER